METQDSARFQLIVHYDGSSFHGWQFQPDTRTVQGELQAGLSRLADSPRTVIGSGRTDTGVHASGQVAAVDMPASWDCPALFKSLNAVIPNDIWVEAVHVAKPDFHPRYHAVARSYTYQVGLRPESASPFHRRWCWPLLEELDVSRLQAAVSELAGEQSFLAFAKSGQPHRGDVCIVQRASWEPWELGVRFKITANRFLHHMVRYLVGTMVDIGKGRRPVEDVARMLANESGVITSPPAPPGGLILAHVEYPDNVRPRPTPSTPEARRTAPA